MNLQPQGIKSTVFIYFIIILNKSTEWNPNEL